MVVFALCLAFLVILAAIAIDLSLVRNDRANNQVAVDNAAAAGVVALTAAGGITGCQDALDYVETAVGSIMAGADCSTLPDRCLANTASVSTVGTNGRFQVTIIHPVSDTDAFMTPGAIGAPNTGISDVDGERCGRLGVSLSETHRTFFGGTLGLTELTSNVHAVALDGTDRSTKRMANLVVLEREDCEVLLSNVGTGSGGIRVGSLTDGSGEVFPGWIAVDSDGTGNKCGAKGTIQVNGTSATVQADGPPGCAGALDAVGSGCGTIQTFASGPPGCINPACSGNGMITPAPIQTDDRVTRAPVDHRWNCKAPYPAAYDIDDCFYAGYLPPYIDQLISAVGGSGVPSGFRSYTGAGQPCTINNGDNVTIPPDNWVVDCELKINGDLTFVGGNLVFDDTVGVKSSGTLAVNDANNATYNWIEGSNLDVTESSSDAAFAFFRSGDLSKSGQGSITMTSTVIYLSSGSAFDITGGSGLLDWSAPTVGPFEDLALWSDSSATNKFGGQTTLTMDGVFFAPLATMEYSGNGSQKQVGAQYIVNQLHVSGQGELVLAPADGRGVTFPMPWPTVLIR